MKQLGDGKRYRGRGWKNTTGLGNYRRLSQATGIDYVSNPDRVAQYPDAATAAFIFWQDNNLNSLADGGLSRSDCEKVSVRINGGYNGFADRWAKLETLKSLI